MKRQIFILLFTFCIVGLCTAQQKVLNHISNEYIIGTNPLNTVSTINQLRNNIYRTQFGDNHPYQVEDLSEYSAYFKILFKKSSSSTETGIAKIAFIKNNGEKVNIEDNVNNFYKIYLMDEDENDYIKQFVKTSTVHGGFFFSKKNNDIYIYIYDHNPNRTLYRL